MSSDRLTLVEDGSRQRQDSAPSACCGSNVTTSDRLGHVAIAFVCVGLVFTAFGFLYPRDMERDPEASARENEALDLEFMRMTRALYAVVITGMVLIGIGGLVLSGLFVNTVVCEDCHARDPENDSRLHTLHPAPTQSGNVHTRAHGPVHNQDGPVHNQYGPAPNQAQLPEGVHSYGTLSGTGDVLPR